MNGVGLLGLQGLYSAGDDVMRVVCIVLFASNATLWGALLVALLVMYVQPASIVCQTLMEEAEAELCVVTGIVH
jgi:hypothetical protein